MREHIDSAGSQQLNPLPRGFRHCNICAWASGQRQDTYASGSTQRHRTVCLPTYLSNSSDIYSRRPVLMIDCADLYSAGSDGAVLQSLSRQTGYRPVFPFVNSMNNLIDIASVGLIGQKGLYGTLCA